MNRYLYLLLLFVSIESVAQIGINTSDVMGVFHLDGKKDNTVGAITPAQESNDIFVDNEGNMGVGTLTPTARLHLKSDELYGAFKLSDGTQGLQRVLLGDADGNAYWGLIKGQGGSIVKMESKPINFRYNVTGVMPLNVTDNMIKIPNEGSFAFMLRWVPRLMKDGITSWDDPTMLYSRSVIIQYNLMLRRAGQLDTVLYSIESRPFMQILNYQSLFEIFVAQNLKKDDSIYLTVKLASTGDIDTNVFLYVNPNDVSSVESQMATESGALIFYKL
ncbi:hypothetical protein [Dysgonomonas sp. HGC4]|uniref:hypothetical protein n=1 Tax=Dysgonomonas sp. HGC4 TaxID=1658009 RepID=UPI000AEEF53E|nr:hypothetical protein [Dysgonomonas sp. HGC4]MBD8346426.1 hypothetical protein [Dysgonomonas sp. HGC4]